MRSEKRSLLIKIIILFIFSHIMMKVDAYLAYKINFDIWERIPIRFFLSIVMLYYVYKYIDKNVFMWSWKKCWLALKYLSPQLLWNIFVCILVIFLSLSEQTMNKQISILPVIGYMLLALVVSLYEEGLYRGIITGGLQKIISQNRRGTILTVLISGAIFGAVHIMSYFQVIKYNPSIVLFEMFTIFLQIGSKGMLYATVYLKNRNIWGGIIVHFVVDIIPFLFSIILPESYGYEPANGDIHVYMPKEQMIIRIIITSILFSVNMLITWRIIKNMHKGSEEANKKEIIG